MSRLEGFPHRGGVFQIVDIHVPQKDRLTRKRTTPAIDGSIVLQHQESIGIKGPRIQIQAVWTTVAGPDMCFAPFRSE